MWPNFSSAAAGEVGYSFSEWVWGRRKSSSGWPRRHRAASGSERHKTVVKKGSSQSAGRTCRMFRGGAIVVAFMETL